ncbi:MAG TPA: hypothetical protein VHM31_11735 [Polyangia bacterium]|nr:hypothetical protein [Polyangia bacterium]
MRSWVDARVLVAFVLAATACTTADDSSARPDGGGKPLICSVTAPTSCPDPAPRYADVAPIISQRCAMPCHSGVPNGPWPLTDYEHVADWADTVRADLLDCSMPPADGGVPITADDRTAVLTWIRCGAPE